LITSKKRCVDPETQLTRQWISEVLHFCQGLPIILVGCKKDLREDPKTKQDLERMNQRPVQRAEGLATAQKIGANGYVECSAKTGEGVREVFQTATRHALSVSPPHVSGAALIRQSKKSGRSGKSKKGCIVL
jgi:Ras family protein A